MTFHTTIELNNGVTIPQLGYGTALISENQSVTTEVILQALEAGYRHLDTATIYYNEEAVGEAIARSNLPREEIFVTTKLWTTDMRACRERESFQESLTKLGLDYVDLYLIHWPVKERYVESWKVMEEFYEEGRARAIGVSNFNPHHIDDIIALEGTIPAVNQYQLHPEFSCPELRAYCREKGIVLQACQPLGQGAYVNNPTFLKLGEKYGCSGVQVVIRWAIQHGWVVLPKSSQKGRLEENAAVFHFELSSSDMAAIDLLNMNKSVVPDADPETFTF